MDKAASTNVLRQLWDSREQRGLLPVLCEMNDMLAKGLITEEQWSEFAGFAEDMPSPPRAASGKAAAAARRATARKRGDTRQVRSRKATLRDTTATARGASASTERGRPVASGRQPKPTSEGALQGRRRRAALDIQRVVRGAIGRQKAAEARHDAVLAWSRKRVERQQALAQGGASHAEAAAGSSPGVQWQQQAHAAALAVDGLASGALDIMPPAAIVDEDAIARAMLQSAQEEMARLLRQHDEAAVTITRALRARATARKAVQERRTRESAALAIGRAAQAAVARRGLHRAAEKVGRLVWSVLVRAATKRAVQERAQRAVVVQSLWRSVRARRHAAARRGAAARLQSHARAWQARQLRARRVASVRTLQRAGRRYVDLCARVREELKAARVLEDWVHARLIVLSERREVAGERAAVAVQAAARGFLVRRFRAKAEAAAVKLQRVTRGMAGRRAAIAAQWARRAAEGRRVAAQTIQSAWRSITAARARNEAREAQAAQLDAHQRAALVLQCGARKLLARRRADELRERRWALRIRSARRAIQGAERRGRRALLLQAFHQWRSLPSQPSQPRIQLPRRTGEAVERVVRSGPGLDSSFGGSVPIKRRREKRQPTEEELAEKRYNAARPWRRGRRSSRQPRSATARDWAERSPGARSSRSVASHAAPRPASPGSMYDAGPWDIRSSSMPSRSRPAGDGNKRVKKAAVAVRVGDELELTTPDGAVEADQRLQTWADPPPNADHPIAALRPPRPLRKAKRPSSTPQQSSEPLWNVDGAASGGDEASAGTSPVSEAAQLPPQHGAHPVPTVQQGLGASRMRSASWNSMSELREAARRALHDENIRPIGVTSRKLAAARRLKPVSTANKTTVLIPQKETAQKVLPRVKSHGPVAPLDTTQARLRRRPSTRDAANGGSALGTRRRTTPVAFGKRPALPR